MMARHHLYDSNRRGLIRKTGHVGNHNWGNRICMTFVHGMGALNQEKPTSYVLVYMAALLPGQNDPNLK